MLTDTGWLTLLSCPRLHCGSLDFQVARGQELLADHERGRQRLASFYVAFFRDRNDRSGSRTHSGTCPYYGSNTGCRALQSDQGSPTKANPSGSQEPP